MSCQESRAIHRDWTLGQSSVHRPGKTFGGAFDDVGIVGSDQANFIRVNKEEVELHRTAGHIERQCTDRAGISSTR